MIPTAILRDIPFSGHPSKEQWVWPSNGATPPMPPLRRQTPAQNLRAGCHKQRHRHPRAENGNGHRLLTTAVAELVDETELTKKPKTLAAYTTALNYFTESWPKPYMHDIQRHDLLKFYAFLREEKKQSPRSAYNKFETVMTFLKANNIRGLIDKKDKINLLFG